MYADDKLWASNLDMFWH